jgi:very-short-patch-repair endonuclease
MDKRMTRVRQSAETIERSRTLRRDASPVERTLWHGLRRSFPQAHFRRQVPLGSYFADFVCHSHQLVIEIDGDTHAHSQNYDAARTEFIQSEGYRVIRFGNNDVMSNLDGVLTAISLHFDQAPTPNPSPRGGGKFMSANL